MSVTVDQMRPKLLTIDQVRDQLATTEPLNLRPFTAGAEVRFDVHPGWHFGLDAKAGTDPVDATIILGAGLNAHAYQLTKDTLLSAASNIGLTKTYAAKCPAELLGPQLNFWYREGLLSAGRRARDRQLLIAGDLGIGLSSASTVPFSNLRLLDQALAGIEARYGRGEVLVDYKFSHDIAQTKLRLIVPEHVRLMTGTGTDDDAWSVGLQITNSCTGAASTAVEGYLFRWWCTNGAITTASPAIWRRSTSANEAEVYDWARVAVDEVLGGLEPALDAVQATTSMTFDGPVGDVLRELFTHYRVAPAERTKIMHNILTSPDDPLTMYSVLAAFTQVANDTDLPRGTVDNLLRIGGDMPGNAVRRCRACQQLTTH